MKKTLNFIRRYWRHSPWYAFVYPFFYFSRRAASSVRFFSQQELIDRLRRGRSLIRLGDGEINFFIGLGNPYQKYDARVETMLREIVREYRADSPYLLAVSQPISLPNFELKQLGRFKVWQPFKIMFRFVFPHDVGYADTHQFYYDRFFESIVAPVFKDRKVVLVTRKETIEKQRLNSALPWTDMVGVEAPVGDAIESYETLKRRLVEKLDGLSRTDVVLFFAVGPAGKYLMYELAKQGWQCVDIGKQAEVMFTDESVEYLI